MYAYRGSTTSTSPSSGTDYTMWTFDADAAYHGYASQDMSRMWRLDISDAVNISILRASIVDAINADIEDGTLSCGMDDIVDTCRDQGLDPAETIADAFDPAHIVDSADGYDNPDMAAWLWDRILDPIGATILLTRDGVICFDAQAGENMGNISHEDI